MAGDTVKADYAGAHTVMDQLAEAGINMDDVTQQLLDAGVKTFANSYNELIRGIAEKVDAMSSGYAKRQHIDTGATTVALDTPEATQVAERIWHRDPNLWKPGDARRTPRSSATASAGSTSSARCASSSPRSRR